MAREATIDWTATVGINGVTVIENDVRVSVSVHGDGEVFVDDIRLTKWDSATGQYLYVPFNSDGDPFNEAAFIKLKANLEADAGFCEKACDEAGMRYVGLGSNDPEGHYVMVGE
jgi:hypothetical protein